MKDEELEAIAQDFLDELTRAPMIDAVDMVPMLRKAYELGKHKDRCVECDKGLSAYCTDCHLKNYAEGFQVGRELFDAKTEETTRLIVALGFVLEAESLEGAYAAAQNALDAVGKP